MSTYKCPECNDTGLIETEGLLIGRAFFNKETQRVECPIVGDGNWQKTECYCIGEE